MISTIDALLDALANNHSVVVIEKASLSNATSGGFHSLWRATGIPTQAAIPTTAALCTKALSGSIGFTDQSGSVKSYLAQIAMSCTNNTATMEVHDRLAHRGGLVLNVTTQQSASLPLTGLSADRLGASNYSEVKWWLEVYSDGGATASNATINVTYNDDTTGNLAVVAVGGTIRASRMIPLVSASAGKYIKAINHVTLSASTGTAGNFGFTATRIRTSLPLLLANKTEFFKWDQTGLPSFDNDACLQIITIPTTTNTGTIRGSGKIAHG